MKPKILNKKLEQQIVSSLSTVPIDRRVDLFESILDLHQVPDDVDIDLDQLMDKARNLNKNVGTEEAIIERQRKMYNKLLQQTKLIDTTDSEEREDFGDNTVRTSNHKMEQQKSENIQLLDRLETILGR
ncbi:MAG: hypothetical protein EOP45_08275 [Sphingobacteriaceae bacterium]|nr:MAG: hypothetical protein EOP45_08275 [Sphingobacteriaceae bacterium]